jgi:hypothetical protein
MMLTKGLFFTKRKAGPGNHLIPQEKTAMKTTRMGILAAMGLLFLTCCGTGDSNNGGGGAPVCSQNGVPQISYSVSTTSLRRGDQFTATYYWCDSDGDIQTVYGQVTALNQDLTESAPASDFGISGTSGLNTVQRTFNYTVPPGRYQLSAWVTDRRGNRSNTVTLSVTVNL